MRGRWIPVVVTSVAFAAPSALSRAETTPDERRAAHAAKRAHDRLDAKLRNAHFAFGDEIFISIFKREAQLDMWLRRAGGKRFELFKTYAICAYSGDLGPKVRLGDNQAPEGFYSVGAGALNPQSNYHLSFNIGYPNAYDRAHGRTGSLIMVHGDCKSIGCFAMTDDGIDEIYSLANAALSAGQKTFKLHIYPFRMTHENMKRHADSRWMRFWENLKEGYDIFRRSNVPPDVSVRHGRYVFGKTQ
jgi:murein L,D-transpeptidase YafK